MSQLDREGLLIDGPVGKLHLLLDHPSTSPKGGGYRQPSATNVGRQPPAHFQRLPEPGSRRGLPLSTAETPRKPVLDSHAWQA
jgi:hypothetical protein